MATSNRNILIVGDSFVAEDFKHPFTWWNKISYDLGCQTINLGISGASNFNIWHQIMHAKQNYEFDKVIVTLTRPNRVEKVLVNDYDHWPIVETHFEDFTNDKIKSWAIHEWIVDGDYPMEVMEKFSPMPLAISRDRIVVNDIVTQLSEYSSCIMNNLFTEYTDNIEDIDIRAYSDVVTGVLDEGECGHLYESMHQKFYDDYGHRIKSLLQK